MRRYSLLLAIALLSAFHLTAANRNGDLYKYLFLEAMTQRAAGKQTAAFDLLRHCVRINPNAAEAYYYLGQYYEQAKDNEHYLSSIKKAAELNPDNSFFLEVLAQAYIDNKQYDKAIGALERLTQTEKDRVDILGSLVQLYEQEEDYPNELKTLERLEILDGKSERLSLAKTNVYSLMAKPEKAVAEMKALADLYPNDYSYRCLYADALLRAGSKKEGQKILDGILKEEPDNYHALLSLRAISKEDNPERADSLTRTLLTNKKVSNDIRMYVMQQEITESENNGGDSTKVLGYFHDVIDGNTADTNVLTYYAAYMKLKKMPDDSIKTVLERVIATAPDNAPARAELVSYAWNAKDFDRVISLCQAARQYNPDEMAFYYYQGMAYSQKNEDDNALEAFQYGLSVIKDGSDPNIVSDFYAITGDLLHNKGRSEEAFAAYDSCLQWKDDNIGCLNNYAYYLSTENRDLNRAEQMSKRTIIAEPKNAIYLDTYAWILFQQKRYAEAKIYIEKALQNDSLGNAVITEHAGDIFYENHDVNRAVELWQKAAETDPGNKILANKIKQRKRIKEKNKK